MFQKFSTKIAETVATLIKYKLSIVIAIFIGLLSIVSTYCFMTSNMIGMSCGNALIFMIYTIIYGYEIQNLKEKLGTADKLPITIQLRGDDPRHLPEYCMDDECFSIYSDNDELVIIKPNEIARIPIPFDFDIPKGYELQFRTGENTGIKFGGLSVLYGMYPVHYNQGIGIEIPIQNNTDKPIMITKGFYISDAVLVKTTKATFSIGKVKYQR